MVRLQERIVSDKMRAIALIQEATKDQGSFMIHRLRAAQNWRKIAFIFKHVSELEAHTVTLYLLDAMTEQSASLEKRYSQMSGHSTLELATYVGSDAAAIALNQNEPELAVALLEQGRGIMFRQVGRLRTTLDEVRAVNPSVARRFEEYSRSLDEMALTARNVTHKLPLEKDPTR